MKAKKSTKELTKKQAEALAMLLLDFKENLATPTLARLGEMMDYSPSHAYSVCQSLEKKGYLRRNELGALVPSDKCGTIEINWHDAIFRKGGFRSATSQSINRTAEKVS